MSNLVPAESIEAIVGVKRDRLRHYARAVSAEQTVYVLHSRECLTSGIDPRECRYSLALDEGIDVDRWRQDEAVRVVIKDGRLVPFEEHPEPPPSVSWVVFETLSGKPLPSEDPDGGRRGD